MQGYFVLAKQRGRLEDFRPEERLSARKQHQARTQRRQGVGHRLDLWQRQIARAAALPPVARNAPAIAAAGGKEHHDRQHEGAVGELTETNEDRGAGRHGHCGCSLGTAAACWLRSGISTGMRGPIATSTGRRASVSTLLL